MTTTSDNEVVVDVPARPRSLRLLRLAAADAAADLDMDLDGVEAARIAIDELGALLLSSGSFDRLVVRLVLEPGRLEVAGAASGGERSTQVPDVDRIVHELLDTCVDDWQVGAGEGGPTFRFTMAVPARDGVSP